MWVIFSIICRHLEAVIKSFDPGQRGWLTAGQTRRLYATLGLAIKDEFNESMPCETIFKKVTEAQENELFDLISAGMDDYWKLRKTQKDS